ncbi:transposase [Micromonospora rosaria]|uniref:Transposase n=1 Tax=Micromonospora rosaria TaxID=47874 RepID=A0A136PNT0_9ACTN|nr:transposase [Micromonospora rosaria]
MEPIQFRMPTIDINIRHELTNEPDPKTIRLLPLQY